MTDMSEKNNDQKVEMELGDLRKAAREQVQTAETAPQPGGISPYQRRRLLHLLRLGGAAAASVFATILLIWGMVSSLADRPPVGPPGVVSGRVTNFAGVSITNVMVRVEGANRTTYTDTAGQFTLEGVPSGQQRVWVELVGVSGMSMPVRVLAFKSVDVGTLELYTP